MTTQNSMKSFKSFAEWPPGTISGSSTSISDDSHDTREQAEGVCRRLQCEGFGGNGKIFPIRTWVEEIEPRPAEEKPLIIGGNRVVKGELVSNSEQPTIRQELKIQVLERHRECYLELIHQSRMVSNFLFNPECPPTDSEVNKKQEEAALAVLAKHFPDQSDEIERARKDRKAYYELQTALHTPKETTAIEYAAFLVSEVERLRAEVERWKDNLTEAVYDRDQLRERVKAMEEKLGCARGWISANANKPVHDLLAFLQPAKEGE